MGSPYKRAIKLLGYYPSHIVRMFALLWYYFVLWIVFVCDDLIWFDLIWEDRVKVRLWWWEGRNHGQLLRVLSVHNAMRIRYIAVFPVTSLQHPGCWFAFMHRYHFILHRIQTVWLGSRQVTATNSPSDLHFPFTAGQQQHTERRHFHKCCYWHSLLHFHLSHMAYHHHLPYHLHDHHLHLLLLVLSFILNLRLGSLPNHFLHRPCPFLPDWFHRLTDHLTFILFNGLICLHGVLD